VTATWPCHSSSTPNFGECGNAASGIKLNSHLVNQPTEHLGGG
jgi:hypothetical protein